MQFDLIKNLLILLSTMHVLGGCVYSNVFEIDEGKSFQGLKDIYQPDNSTLNVVFVHGMGHHPFGEPDLLDYQIRIAQELGFNESDRQLGVRWHDSCGSDFEDYPDFSDQEMALLNQRLEAGQAVCALRIHEVILGFVGWQQYRSSDSQRVLNLFELSWDRATERLQKVLLELDDKYLEKVKGSKNREKDRVMVNRWLKKFVNMKLGDPAIYIGDYGQSIRQIVADGLSKIATAAGMQGNYKYSIVSDSLGSRVIFDALGCAHDATGCEQTHRMFKSRKENINILKNIESATSQVFMNANQLPFLALGNVKAPNHYDTETMWLNRFPCEGGGPLPIKKAVPIKIVAFTDPNDALSYHLTDRFRKKCVHLSGKQGRSVEFINVRLSNVKWHFGIFANPNKAHSGGFRTNDKAIDLLVNGYHKQ